MWLWVVCCAELPNLANIAIYCYLMLGEKKELVWGFCEKWPSEICQRYVKILWWWFSALAVIWPRSNLGQIAEGNSLSKKEQTDEIEQQIRMNKQWRWTNNEDVVMTSGRVGYGLRCGLARSDWQHSSWEWDGLDLRGKTNKLFKKGWLVFTSSGRCLLC